MNMKYQDMNQDHVGMIERNLMTEYKESEVNRMLSTAEFSKIENGYKVKYDNGFEDKFFFVTTLVHESEVDLHQ